MTNTAPRNPWTHVDRDAHPKLTTKSGMANGTTTSTAHTRRPGRSVRSTHHAVRVPITAQSAVTTTVSRTLFHNKEKVKDRQMRRVRVVPPPPRASINKKTSGVSKPRATIVLVPRRIQGGELRRVGT